MAARGGMAEERMRSASSREATRSGSAEEGRRSEVVLSVRDQGRVSSQLELDCGGRQRLSSPRRASHST
mgnify:CR=1 FL=1